MIKALFNVTSVEGPSTQVFIEFSLIVHALMVSLQKSGMSSEEAKEGIEGLVKFGTEIGDKSVEEMLEKHGSEAFGPLCERVKDLVSSFRDYMEHGEEDEDA